MSPKITPQPDNEQNDILKEIDSNTELALLQSEKIANSVDNLEPIMEGVLVKTDELVNEQKKTNELLQNKEESKQIVADEMTVTLKGLKGDKGDKGDIGETGPQGVQGEKGNTGATGNDGYTPIKGVDYFDGADGKDGKTPVAGIDFPLPKDGADGKMGPRGPKGNSGSPDTGEEIKKKLESLEIGLNYDSLHNRPNIEDYIQRIKSSSRDYNLSELKDVAINSMATNGQALVYSTSINKWVPGTPSGVLTTASNGLTAVGTDVELGGTLDHPTTVLGTIDPERSIRNVWDIDGSILGVPSIANIYEDTASGITTGLITVGDVGFEGSQMLFQDGTNLTTVSVDSLNAVVAYSNANFSTSFSATDVGIVMSYNDSLNSVIGGLSFGSQYARLSRITDDTVQIGAVEIGLTYLEIYRRVTGLRRHGSILMEDDLITIGDPTNQSTGTNIIIDIANSDIILTKEATLKEGFIVQDGLLGKFYNGGGTNYTSLQGGSGMYSGDIELKLPSAYPAVSGYALVSDTSGNMSWSAAGGLTQPQVLARTLGA